MPRRRKPDIVFALRTVVISRPEVRHVTEGQAWYADHPVVKENPSLFAELPPEVHPRGFEPVVEQATAAPGEKRTPVRADDD